MAEAAATPTPASTSLRSLAPATPGILLVGGGQELRSPSCRRAATSSPITDADHALRDAPHAAVRGRPPRGRLREATPEGDARKPAGSRSGSRCSTSCARTRRRADPPRRPRRPLPARLRARRHGRDRAPERPRRGAHRPRAGRRSPQGGPRAPRGPRGGAQDAQVLRGRPPRPRRRDRRHRRRGARSATAIRRRRASSARTTTRRPRRDAAASLRLKQLVLAPLLQLLVETLTEREPKTKMVALEEADEKVFLDVTTSVLRSGDGRAQGAVGVIRDRSAEKILEEQLAHTERLATLGSLLASIAHEIANPLSVITGCAEVGQDTAKEAANAAKETPGPARQAGPRAPRQGRARHPRPGPRRRTPLSDDREQSPPVLAPHAGARHRAGPERAHQEDARLRRKVPQHRQGRGRARARRRAPARPLRRGAAPAGDHEPRRQRRAGHARPAQAREAARGPRRPDAVEHLGEPEARAARASRSRRASRTATRCS